VRWLFGLKWLVDHGILPRGKAGELLRRRIVAGFYRHRAPLALASSRPGRDDGVQLFCLERGGIKRQTSGRMLLTCHQCRGGWADPPKSFGY